MRPNAAAAVRLGRRTVTTAALAAQRAGVRPPAFVQAPMRRLLEGAACLLPEALVPGWDSPPLPGGVALIGGSSHKVAGPCLTRPSQSLSGGPGGGRLCLVAAGSLDVGGMDEVAALLAYRLPEHGWRTVVLHTDAPSGSPTPRLAAALSAAGIGVISVPEPVSLTNILLERPDVVSVHGAPTWVVEHAATAGIPVVETLHGVHDMLGRSSAAETERARCTARVVAVSELVREQYLTRNPTFPRERAVTVPNGVDNLRRRPVPRSWARDQLGFTDEFLFVSLARYCLQKNTYALLQAFADVAQRCAEVHLLVAGRPDDPVYTRQIGLLAGRLPCASRVHLRGHHPDPAALLAAADAFVLDSFFEGWSLASMEALCAGVPIVLSDVGGAREQVASTRGLGWLVPNPLPAGETLSWNAMASAAYAPQHNREQLAEAMLRLVHDHPRNVRRREALARDSQERFSVDRMLAGHAAVLSEAVRDASGAPAR